MSRIGKRPVAVPSGVTATITGQTVTIKGPKGQLAFTVPEDIKVESTAAGIEVTPRDESKRARALWGTARTRIANLVTGVTQGYAKTLEIHGTGFRAVMKVIEGKNLLQLQVGYSHDILHRIPPGVEIKLSGAKADKQDVITVSGIDKQLVGQIAAELRAYRKPEPYQGYGIRYQGEYVLRKVGKTK